MTEHKTCGAATRSGGTCKLPAGSGTSHPGWGRCRFHAGSTPTGIAAAVKEQAKAEAARLGMEIALDPADALGLAVRLAAGEVEWLRWRIVERERDEPDADLGPLASALASANERLARVAKLAADAGVDERRLQLDALVIDRLGAAVQAAITDAALGEDARARLDVALRHRLGELSDDDLRPKALGA